MSPELLIFPITQGALLISRAAPLTAFAGAARAGASPYGSRLLEILVPHADGSRNAVVAWGLEGFGRLRRPNRDLADQIARMVETGRLTVRFLPLFRDDPRGPREEGPLRVYQLGSGPLECAPAPAQAPSPSLAVQRTQVRSAVEPEKDFEDEERQIAVLRAAAKDGTPFCEPCARAAIRASKAAHSAA
jgi:hypothetical protein